MQDGEFHKVKENFWFIYNDDRGNQIAVIRQSLWAAKKEVKDRGILGTWIYRDQDYWESGQMLFQAKAYDPIY